MNRNQAEISSCLSKLGIAFRSIIQEEGAVPSFIARDDWDAFNAAIMNSTHKNPWFTRENVRLAIESWGIALDEVAVKTWLSRYTFAKKPKIIGLVLAGNIPMAGLHDLLCVLASGNRALVKLSSDDTVLLPAIHRLMSRICPELEDQVVFEKERLRNFDAIIATGSNNSARYFEYYFGKYPHIIRKNRNGVGVITGNVSAIIQEQLGMDIFSYFGLGCRNVSKIYIPKGYHLKSLLDRFNAYKHVESHSKYMNNYDYQKSIFLINGVPFLDNGFLLMREEPALISPISVVNYEFYDSIDEVNECLASLADTIQCVVSSSPSVNGAIPMGSSQFPQLWDYADGVDTMRFLNNLEDQE